MNTGKNSALEELKIMRDDKTQAVKDAAKTAQELQQLGRELESANEKIAEMTTRIELYKGTRMQPGPEVLFETGVKQSEVEKMDLGEFLEAVKHDQRFIVTKADLKKTKNVDDLHDMIIALNNEYEFFIKIRFFDGWFKIRQKSTT